MTRATIRHTSDSLLGGALRLVQPKTGYRVNVDSLLLVAFAGERRVDRVVDLGAGVGALGLLALHRGIGRRALLVEADPALVRLAEHNLAQADFAGEARQLDVRREKLAETGVPLILCNPPYYPARSHRPAREAGRALARSGELLPFLAAASGALARSTGRALFCYPAPQLAELLEQAATHKLVAKRMRFVHARESEPARLVLVELRVARPGGLVIEAPLIEWQGKRRSAELSRLTGDRAADQT